MKFARLLIAGLTTFALTVTASSSVGAPAPRIDLGRGQAVAERPFEPLPRDAVSPQVASGRWFVITSEPGGPGALRARSARQALIKITGPRARQEYRFDVSLPAGSRLLSRGDGLVVRDTYGAVTGVVEAPWAVDGTGISIATRFEIIDSNTFAQIIEHRPLGATYPVYADPFWVVPVLIAGGRLLGRYVVKRATVKNAKKAAKAMASAQADVDIDDLKAKQPAKLLKLNRKNFRENVRRRTRWSKEAAEGYHAHHTLVRKFEDDFNDAGINIHHPVYGHWWCGPAHLSAASDFNKAWKKWLDGKNIEDKKIWRKRIERKRIKMVGKSEWSSTYQCQDVAAAKLSLHDLGAGLN